MDLVPKRHSLVTETTTLLREAIAAGRWPDLLPGERKLCQQMQIGRDTLRAAIQQLEQEGLVLGGEAGKQRKILTPRGEVKNTTAASAGIIAFLSPQKLEQFPNSLLVEIDVLRERLAGSGYRLEVVTGTKVFTQAQPGHGLNKLTADYAAEAWILHQTTAPMQRWFAEKGPPSLLHGQPQGVELPAVDVDYMAVGRHAGGFLISRGHREVVILRPHASLRGLDMAETGLREAFVNHPGDALPTPMTLRESEAGGAAALASKIGRLMKSQRQPTALVLTRSRQALTMVSWLAKQRLRVPEDLSLISLDYSQNFDHLLPAITCYRSDPEITAKIVFRKVIEIASSGVSIKSPPAIMPDFITGGSVAKIS